MQIHSREVLFFLEVSRFSSFSDAANAMNIPASTVSRRILELESRLKQKLFVRSKFGVDLSDFGEQFLSASRDVEKSLNNLKALAQGRLNAHNSVIVEALHPITILIIKDFLPFFRQQYPDMVVDVRSVSHAEQTQSMGEHIRLQTHTFAHSKYQFIPFVNAKRHFYLHPKLAEQYPDLHHPKDILKNGVSCIGIRNNVTPSNIWSYVENGRANDLVIQPSLIVDDAGKAREAVLNGAGASWNYDVLMRTSLEKAEVVELFSPHFSTRESAYVCFERSKVLSDSEQLFIDALCRYYQS